MKRFASASAVLALLATSAIAMPHAVSGNAYSPPPPPEKLITIFGNLNNEHPKGLYFPDYARYVAGPQNGLGVNEVKLASAFVSSTDHRMTKLQLALRLRSGVPRVDIGLYTDKDGAPGIAIKTWRVKTLTSDLRSRPPEGSRCAQD